MVSAILEIIRENINLVKDFFTIIFYVTVAVIAILTFIRAKETFLQPVRSEVIKKQTELMTDLLKTLHKNNIDFGLDYPGVVRVNIFRWLIIYGFILKDQEKVRETISRDIDQSTLFFPDENIQLDDLEIITSFDDKKETKIAEDPGKALYEKAKRGEININKIFITKKHRVYRDKLHFYVENPFLPNSIKVHLESLINDIDTNIKIHLRKVLGSFIREVFNRKGQTRFSPDGVFNEFNHVRIHHASTYDILKSEVRKYLKIDSMP